ncbi:MAG: rRNA maturation RNase YbeY [Bacteroidota bacterium]
MVKRVLTKETRFSAEINVIFTNDKQMVKLNASYLHHNYPTDVISFSLPDPGQSAITGEIYINIDQAQRQSKMYQVKLSNELARLTIHGVLHLLGYNDATMRGKKTMTSLENRYLQ